MFKIQFDNFHHITLRMTKIALDIGNLEKLLLQFLSRKIDGTRWKAHVIFTKTLKIRFKTEL